MSLRHAFVFVANVLTRTDEVIERATISLTGNQSEIISDPRLCRIVQYDRRNGSQDGSGSRKE